MTLFELKAAYAAGELAKAAYIERMHERHKELYAYADFIRATGVEEIAVRAGEVIMTLRQPRMRLIVDPRDRRNIPVEILNFGDHEAEEMAVISHLVGDGGVVFDVGANIGWFALYCQAMARNVVVYAFEPLPTTCGYLRRNVELNGAVGISCYNTGFSDEAGTVSFYLYPEGPGNASLADVSGRDSVEEVRCDVVRLDGFMAGRDTGMDLLKVDVEGAELLVFKGGVKTLERLRPVIMVEMLRKWAKPFGYHPNETIALLTGLGYACYAMQGGSLQPFASMDDDTVETNFIFLHQEAHAALADTLAAKGVLVERAVRP